VAGDAELVQQGGDAALERLLGEVELGADLPAGEAVGDEAEDALSWGLSEA
jgi:hypothetical protein